MYMREHHELTHLTSEIKAKSKDTNHLVGILLAEEAYSFALTFQVYNNATVRGSREGDILVDRVLEAEFTPQKVIYVEFLTPVFLS